MKAGDHILIMKGGGAEHAIEVGDRTVIHFAKGGGVKRSRLAELAPVGATVIVVTHRERVFPPRRVVARAFSRFAESAYAAMFPDSEAFAIWCKTGRVPMQASATPSVPEHGPFSHEPPLPAVTASRPVPAKRTKPRAKQVAAARTGRSAKKPVSKRAVKASATLPKPARSAKSGSPSPASRAKSAPPRRSAPSAKPGAFTKAAASAKRTSKAKPSRKPARAAKPSRKTPRPAKAQKGAAPARNAKPGKRRKGAVGRAAGTGR